LTSSMYGLLPPMVLSPSENQKTMLGAADVLPS